DGYENAGALWGAARHTVDVGGDRLSLSITACGTKRSSMVHRPAPFRRGGADAEAVPFGLVAGAPTLVNGIDPGFHHFAEERVCRFEYFVEFEIARPRNVPAAKSAEHAPIRIESCARETKWNEHLVAAILLERATASLLDHGSEREIATVAVGVFAAW